LNLNEVDSTSSQYSPSNSPKDIVGKNNSVLVCEKLMSVMPNFYIDGEISKVNINILITFTASSNSFTKQNIIVSNNSFIEHAS